MVCRSLVHDQPEAWSQRARPTALAGTGKLSNRMDHLAEAAHGHGAAWAGCSVEVDETYVGGIEHGVRGPGTESKFIVVIAIEVLSPKGFGRVRLERVNDVSGASLIPFVTAAVESGTEVRTDGWRGDYGLSKKGYIHRQINISSSGDPAHVSLPGVPSVASLLKRWLLGTHQGSVTAAHLDAYLNEFAFRFNRRHSRRRGLLFLRLLQHAVVTPPTRYRPSRSLDKMENHSLQGSLYLGSYPTTCNQTSVLSPKFIS